MNINKIASSTDKTASCAIEKLAKKSPQPLSSIANKKLLNELDAMASCARAQITNKNNNPVLPEFLYHITSKENYQKILKDGKMKASSWEAASDNGCNGIYFIDKENFLKKWVGRKMPEEIMTGGDVFSSDIGELLMLWTSKGNPCAIKIPVSSLNLSQLRFRPYLEACYEAIETLDSDTGKINSEMVRKGLSLDKLSQYLKSSEPLEYIYFGDITPNLFKDCLETPFSENIKDMIYGLFG